MEKQIDKKKCPYNVTSFVLGILSVLGCLFYYISIPTGVLAIIFGVKGTKKSGSGLAKTGMILGIVGLSLMLFIYIFFIAGILLEF